MKLNKKILITGSEGFLGTYLKNYYLKKNYQVVGLDNLSKYKSKSKTIISNKKFLFHKVDCSYENKIFKYLKGCDSIIINGGTTTFQMVHPLVFRRLAILTNSFPLAEHLLKHSKNTITLSGGTIYREQNILLSPFENDITRNFHAKYMFIGAQGISPLGLVEADPLVIQAEQKLIRQADELVVLADSSKFDKRSSLIICELSKISTIITDYKISDKAASMLDAADVNLIVTRSGENQYEGEAAS